MQLEYCRQLQDPDAWSRRLGVSREAIDLYAASDVIDLHVDTYIWCRMFGYDLCKRHGLGPTRGRFFGQADLPRMREAGVSGALWSITTWPLRGAAGRARAFVRNLRRLKGILEHASGDVAIVRNLADYRAAQARGQHGAFLSIQGGNALDRDLAALDALSSDLVVRVTLVHLSNSRIGGPSAPFRLSPDRGLSRFGQAFVEALNSRRVLVDLAHMGRRGFAQVVETHDPSLPLVVTHTGVNGVYPCWRNLDDGQLRAVARFGGTVGVIFHSGYLNGRQIRRAGVEHVVDHLVHILRVVGDEHASIGSDFDGFIVPPRDMKSCLELPRLVQGLLSRGVAPESITKILGGNFLRVLRDLRGG